MSLLTHHGLLTQNDSYIYFEDENGNYLVSGNDDFFVMPPEVE